MKTNLKIGLLAIIAIVLLIGAGSALASFNGVMGEKLNSAATLQSQSNDAQILSNGNLNAVNPKGFKTNVWNSKEEFAAEAEKDKSLWLSVFPGTPTLFKRGLYLDDNEFKYQPDATISSFYEPALDTSKRYVFVANDHGWHFDKIYPKIIYEV